LELNLNNLGENKMKRLIKYYNKYNSDKAQFSTCSTEYSIFPELVNEEAEFSDLKFLAEVHGLKVVGRGIETEMKYRRNLFITHAYKLDEIETIERWGKIETYQFYLGFITIPESDILAPIESIDNEMTLEQAYEIVNNQELGVSDFGEMVDGGIVMVKSGWNYFHEIPLLGYNLKQFEELLKITDTGFYDDTDRCGNCGKFDSRDSGYTYNFREFQGDLLGVNCGCYEEACSGDDGIEEFSDNPDKAMELSSAEKLAEENKIEFIERFIGGMTDGRGGYFGGEYTREGQPEKILKELKEKDPNKSFLFSHDESGQFQTYFSVWSIRGE
jgi:hypothetical protein